MKLKLSLFLIILVVVITSCDLGKNNKDEKKVDFNVDHGFHENIWEWVYFSGVVETEDANKLSIMFTIFQQESYGKFSYPRILTVLDPVTGIFYEQWDISDTDATVYDDHTGLVVDNAKYKMEDNGSVSISGLFSSSGNDFGIDLILEPTLDPLLHGNWTYRSGSGETFYGEEYILEASDEFIHETDSTIAKYPIDWKIEIPDINATFNLSPVIPNQAVSYIWEGLFTMNGSIGGDDVSGDAFVELSGYIISK